MAMVNRIVSTMVVCLGLSFSLLATGCASTRPGPTPAKDGVFVHIKSGPDNPHDVLMGLRMAQLMSQDRDVLVYFDVDGTKAVLQAAPDLKMEPFGSSHAMVQDLVARKVHVFACPSCLKALGNTPEQLMPGVKVAEKEAFFNFTRGRILTMDY
jgi:predicted peroxiredoxin